MASTVTVQHPEIDRARYAEGDMAAVGHASAHCADSACDRADDHAQLDFLGRGDAASR